MAMVRAVLYRYEYKHSTVSLADTYSEQLRADPTPSSKTLASAPDIDKWVSSWN